MGKGVKIAITVLVIAVLLWIYVFITKFIIA